jgi:hypothetical protein
MSIMMNIPNTQHVLLDQTQIVTLLVPIRASADGFGLMRQMRRKFVANA